MSEKESDSLFSQVLGESNINLSIGAPGPKLLSRLSPIFSQGCSDVLSEGGDISLFQYGPESGTTQFRRELSQFLSRRYQESVDPDQLILTTGATNGLHLAVSCLVSGSGVVFVENPTYFIALDILKQDLGLSVVPVNMTDDGVDVDSLESKIQSAACLRKTEEDEDGRYWAVYYSIPTFHNPTGITFSKTVTKRIVELSEKYNILVICDDIYNLLPYNKQSSPRLKSQDTHGNVISNGTFSKILCPGVRLGWLEASNRNINKLKKSGVLLSGGSQNNLMSGIVTSILQSGALDTTLEFELLTFTERMDAAVGVLREGLSSDWRVINPGGGYFLWVTNSAGADLTSFCSWLKTEKGVTVLRGSQACPYTYLEQNKETCCRASFRLSIAYYEKDTIVKACRVICEAIKEYFE